ncbi:FbpB family small basic protein [Bacillus alkalicellulosilyticus]|nr:FbpB family small basic protein [Bacillus alkalicellulosilyticus]
MRKIRKLTFEELIEQNKQQLLNDKDALDKIEQRWEEKITEKSS